MNLDQLVIIYHLGEKLHQVYCRVRGFISYRDDTLPSLATSVYTKL